MTFEVSVSPQKLFLLKKTNHIILYVKPVQIVPRSTQRV